MPRWQKRKHLKGDEVSAGSYETEKNTKCSLSSLCHPEDRDIRPSSPPDHPNQLRVDIRPYLRGAIVYCNKLRVLISMVAKHHIFAILTEQAEEAAQRGIPNTLPLPFEPNQNYYSRVKTMIVKGALSNPKPSYDASLQISKNAVLGTIPCPAYDGQLTKSTLNAMIGYMVKQLAENLATHVETHAQDCVKNWVNNQLRAQLTDDQYNSKYHRRHIGTWKKKLLSENLSEISAAHEDYKQQLPPELKRKLSSNSLSDISAAHEEYDRELKQLSTAKPSTAGLVALFCRLRLDIDSLEASTNRAMKLMAVVPEAKIGLTFVKIDRCAAKHMVKDIYKAINRAGAEYDSNMSEEEHWGTLFDLDKVKRLRDNTRFGFSILTDGIAACVLFKVSRPKSEKPVKKSVLAWTRANAPPRDITGPGLYSEKDNLSSDHTHLVAFDPGVRSILTGVRLDKSNGKPFIVTQGEYRETSMLTWTMKKLGSHTTDFREWMGGVMETLTNAPSKKSVLRYSEYLRALGSVWDRSWAYHARRKLQRIKFYAWRRREAWMTKLVSRIKEYAEGGPVLFGNGADSGLFGRVRGAGMKGPVLEIKKRLSEQMPVIVCSEFRTSKLCLDYPILQSMKYRRQN